MRTLKMFIIIMALSLFANVLSAQVSVGVNIGVPAPRYYYLQDIESYWDIQASMYIYLSGGRWIHARSLPPSYGHYDFEHGNKIIIRDYRGNRPYSYFHDHRSRFPKGHSVGAGNNYWSRKEYNGRGNNNRMGGKEFKRDNKQAGKEFKRENKREQKEFKRENKMNNKGNGNRGGGDGGGHGKGGGGGKGKR